MNNLINIKAKVLNQPLLLEPSYAQVLIGAIAERMDVEQLTTVLGEKLSLEDLKEGAFSFSNDRSERKPYTVSGGVAMIPVSGSLVTKTNTLRPYSGMTGYDGIKANLDMALEDSDVSKIALMMDSAGGEVIGCFELADFIYANRDTKEMTAVVSGLACSACYALASACNRIVMSENSTVGSIGVITAHTDVSEAMANQGVKVTLITAGAHKADGNPYEALPADVQARIQSRLDTIHTGFATRVAKFRGMTVDAIFKTEALTYLGSDAIDVGLADDIVSTIDFIDDLSHSGGSNINLESNMNVEEHEKALATATAAAKVEGIAEGQKAGATAAKTLIQGILGSDEANGRTGLAEHMAYETDMTVDAAVKMLAMSPAEAAPAPAVEEAASTGFVEAMAEHGAPAIEAEGDPETAVTAESDPVAFALQSLKQIG